MWATQLGGDCLYRIGQPAIILAPWTGLHANVLLVSHGLYSPVSQVPRIIQLVPRVLIGCPAVAWVSTYAMDRRSIHCRCDQSQLKYITDFGHPVVSTIDAESYQISLSTSKLHPLSVFSSCIHSSGAVAAKIPVFSQVFTRQKGLKLPSISVCWLINLWRLPFSEACNLTSTRIVIR